MYSVTNFLSVLWYTVAGWFGVGQSQARAVTLFDGSARAPLDSTDGASIPNESAILEAEDHFGVGMNFGHHVGPGIGVDVEVSPGVYM
jgi:hypothetical protein